MYDVMIVDDDYSFRRGMPLLIEWEKYGFSIKAQAENGIEASVKAVKNHFDLIISDIRMPGLDGIGFIKELQRNGYAGKTVLLSGYKDFEYAKEAVNYGVSNYLLKPVNKQNLIDTLIKLRKEMDEQQKENSLRAQSRRALINDTYISIIKHGIVDTSIMARAHDLELPIHGKLFCVVLCEPDTADNKRPEGNSAQNDTGHSVSIDMKKVQAAAPACKITDSRSDEGEILLLFVYCSSNFKAFKDEIVCAVNEAVPLCRPGYTISIGSVEDNIASVFTSYQRAKNALRFRYLYETEGIIDVTNLPSSGRKMIGSFDFDFRKLYEMLFSGDTDGFEAELEHYIEKIKEDAWPKEMIVGMSGQLLKKLIAHMDSQGLELEAISGCSLSYEALVNIRSVHEMRIYLGKICMPVCEFYSQTAESAFLDEKTGKVVSYIHKNYSSAINLQTTADIFGINAAYLGRTFKAKIGKTFTDYLNEYRLKRAVEMLEEGTLGIDAISQRCGFTSPAYFYRVFKKFYSVTPAEYIRRLKYSLT